MTVQQRWIGPGLSAATFGALTVLVLTYSPAKAAINGSRVCEAVCHSHSTCYSVDMGCVAVAEIGVCKGTWEHDAICPAEEQWCETECA